VDEPEREQGLRRAVTTGFSTVQDVVYVALGVLLSAAAVVLLVQAGVAFVDGIATRDVRSVVNVLDRILLALMIVELLYTVQVSFREHALMPEPFLLVALIAAVRRILVITAEFSAHEGVEADAFRRVLWELMLLTGLIVVLVGALVVLQRNASERRARSHHA
jgi:phosphate starvation-inducible membrane PsiE